MKNNAIKQFEFQEKLVKINSFRTDKQKAIKNPFKTKWVFKLPLSQMFNPSPNADQVKYYFEQLFDL